MAFLPPHSSRFNFHSYAQCEPTPPQKLAQKLQLQPFTKDYGGHSLLQTSFAELPNILLPSFSGGFQAHKLLFTAILLKTKCWLCNKNTHVLLTYMPVCFSQTIPPPPPTLCLRTQQWQGPEVWLLGSHWLVLVTARWPASVTGTAASWPVWRNHPSATVCLSPSSKKSTLHPKVSEAVVMGVDLCKVCFISYQGVWHYSQKWVRL